MTQNKVRTSKRWDKRKRRPIFWVVVCKDGCPHFGFRQMGTLDEAREIVNGIPGFEKTRLDDWGYTCKPHKIVKFIPA